MNILVVVAHPDDEILGCGGTIARHTKQGDVVHVAILAEGLTSRSDKRDREAYRDKLSELAAFAQRANEIIGVSSLTLLNLPDNRMDSIDVLDVVKTVETLVEKTRSDVVYTHHAGDLNIDHSIVHNAVITACRPVPGCTVKQLLFFEIPSSTEWQVPGSVSYFMPNWFVDITGVLSLKLEALAAYNSEMRDWPHPRSLRAAEYLAGWRGASVGVEAAEAFILGRNIVK
ncbi:MAG TPA: PIG-L family deacetylase [Candidatus Aquicultor sp.]